MQATSDVYYWYIYISPAERQRCWGWPWRPEAPSKKRPPRLGPTNLDQKMDQPWMDGSWWKDSKMFENHVLLDGKKNDQVARAKLQGEENLCTQLAVRTPKPSLMVFAPQKQPLQAELRERIKQVGESYKCGACAIWGSHFSDGMIRYCFRKKAWIWV